MAEQEDFLRDPVYERLQAEGVTDEERAAEFIEKRRQMRAERESRGEEGK